MKTIEVSSKLVRQLAKECLTRICDLREAEKEKLLIAERKRLTKSWWRKFCLKRVPTDREIAIYLSKYDWEYCDMDHLYRETELKAEELFLAAQENQSIIISIEDLKRIGG